MTHPLLHENPGEKRENDRDRELNTLGFAIYDFIHIFAAIAFIIMIITGRDVTLDSGEVQADLAIELADEFTELILSFLLIFFVIFIFRSKTQKTQMSYYTFAWLIASLSLLIPATFEIPALYIYHHGATYNAGIYVLRNFNLYLPLLAFFAFIFALFSVHDAKRWTIALTCGIIAMLLFCVSSTVVYVFEQVAAGIYFAHPFQALLRHIFMLAPIVPAVFTFSSLRYFDVIDNCK